jgi:hypothetical protein
MDAADSATENTAVNEQELRHELHGLLRRMLVEDLKARETVALQAVTTNPEALDTYKQLHQQRVALLHQIQQQMELQSTL